MAKRPSPTSVSVITEWENAFLSEDDRTFRTMQALGEQVRTFWDVKDGQKTHPQSEYLKQFEFPIPLLLTYFEEWDGEAIKSQIAEAFADNLALIDLRLLPTPEKKYYIIKSKAAKASTTDLTVFLDCDAIPEGNWLIDLVSSFAVSEFGVVFGLTVVDHDDLYTKSFSLIKFQRPVDDPQLVPTNFGFANNLCIYTDTLQAIHWPPSVETYKLANLEWLRMLKEGGVAMGSNQQAVVRHPAPLPRNYVTRAFFHGRDEMIDRLNIKKMMKENPGAATPMSATGESPLRTVLRRFTSPFRNRKRVGLRWWEVPLAFMLVVLYYVGFFGGYVVTLLFPKYSIEKFDYLVMAE